MSLPLQHRLETELLLREQSKSQANKLEIARWILEDGYYPEAYVIPPCFKIKGFNLSKDKLETKDYNNGGWKSYEFATLSFPKTGLIQRVFSAIHPKRYHDIVWELMENWDELLDKLFDSENKIISYSFPLAISKDSRGKLRSGRMIYEFLEMAEKDLVAEAHKYSILGKVDITNFYNSVYTHTISWAWIGDRKTALNDSRIFKTLGTKLDKLVQYSNDKRTNGLAVGPVLSDLIVEIILTERDKEISKRIKSLNVDYIATRFKDDYRILANSKDECNEIIKIIIEVLNEFNLQVNESKTKIIDLPEGLYRQHSLNYEPYSLRGKYESKKIPFKAFEFTLLKALEIHREYLGTSLLEKFLSELIDNNKKIAINEKLLISFTNEKIPKEKENYENVRKKNIKKAISLLLMVKNESAKSLGKVLSIIECIWVNPKNKWMEEENYLFDIFMIEIEKALIKSSAFELTWLIYFTVRHNFKIDLDRLIKTLSKDGKLNGAQGDLEILKNCFVATLRNKMPNKGKWENPFGDKNIKFRMYTNPEELTDVFLIDYLDVFERAEPEN